MNLTVAARGRPRDGRPSHRRGRRHLPRAGPGPGARRARWASPATARPRCPWTSPVRRARSTSPVAGCARSRPSCPPGAIGNFDHELTEEFLRALATNARLTLHVTIEAGTNAHHVIEAAFKAVARALRMAVSDRPHRDRGAVDQGDAVLTATPRIAVIDYGMGNRRSVQKALEHVGAQAELTRDPERLARRRRARAAGCWRLPARDAQPGRARAPGTAARGRRRRAATARHLPGDAAPVRALGGVRLHAGAGADPRSRHPDAKPVVCASRTSAGTRSASSGPRR